MDRTRHSDHGPAGPQGAQDTVEAAAPDVELYEADTVRPLPPSITRGTAGRGRPFGLSLPGAIASALLVTALAFGAGGMLPASGPDKPATDAGTTEPGATQGTVDADTANTGDNDEPTAKPDNDGEAPAKTDEPGETDRPDETEPAVEVERIELVARAGDGKVILEWSACDAEGFVAWKVVRSTDEGVSWPKGEGDALVAAISDQGTRRAVDTDAPKGKKLWYRVFALVDGAGDPVVGCKSTVDTAFLDKPAPEPTDKPEPATLELSVSLKGDHPYLDWSACSSARFDLYKVVRSKDSTVTWPAGDNDAIVAAIGDREQTAFKDADAPGGRKLWYRVFCLDKTEAGYVVLAASGAKAITTPTPEPPPDPVTLGFEAGLAEGAVLLDWESCTSDAFVYYKVVRSHNPNPSYLPWTEGTELISVIESAGNSAFEDSDVASGQTWYYRVQAIGKWNGEKVVLGQTPVIEVTIP
ncbi:MAG: hypothetical protein A2V85_14960 [Chloroflexi bacterium RBG_16_72_14]|nr:MAG: hypothetical protein A2V85_14960 [Chloroflexi bacterium RBG_16_72_14]